MALAAGTNSYVTLVEANAYFADRLDVAAWDEAADPLKEQALVTAAGVLETYTWIGTIKEPGQAMAWPRAGQYFDPRAGYLITLDGVPQRVKTAQMELAHHFLQNDGVLDNSGSVESVKVGPIEVKGIRVASASSATAYAHLSPLLATQGKSLWWRAN